MATRLAVVLLTVVVTTGCTPQERAGFDGIATPEPTPSIVPQQAGPDPLSLPAEPDEAYVEAVANALYAAEGQLLSVVLSAPAAADARLEDATREGLRTLFVGDELMTRMEQAEALAADPAARAGLLSAADFSGLAFSVERVAYADDRCLVALVRVRRSGVVADAPESPGLSALSLSLPADGPSTPNPTAWQARDLLANTDVDGTANDDSVLLDATLADFGDALDHTCEGETSRRP